MLDFAPKRCKVVRNGASMNYSKHKRSQRQARADGQAPRISVTFEPDQYEALVRVAKSKRVSLAWVIRDAAIGYVEEAAPQLKLDE
jgi:hypothetical protein